MCDIWKKNYSKEISCEGLVLDSGDGEYTVKGTMNSLGNSRADNARYDELKLKREDLYRECIPILKGLVELNQNEEAIKTLMNIYGTLGDNEGFKEMKALLE